MIIPLKMEQLYYRDESSRVIKDVIDDAVLNDNVVTIYFEEEILVHSQSWLKTLKTLKAML